jgi:hypothetical protein
MGVCEEPREQTRKGTWLIAPVFFFQDAAGSGLIVGQKDR